MVLLTQLSISQEQLKDITSARRFLRCLKGGYFLTIIPVIHLLFSLTVILSAGSTKQGEGDLHLHTRNAKQLENKSQSRGHHGYFPLTFLRSPQQSPEYDYR